MAMMNPELDYMEENPPEDQAPSHQGWRSRGSREHVVLLVLGALLAAAAIVIWRVAFVNIRTTMELQMLRGEYEAAGGGSLRCNKDWELYRGKCYFFSSFHSPWEKGRRKCQDMKGDLVKIDSREEQVFLSQRVTRNMENAGDLFWLGLTDSAAEGRWLWVDGSPLNHSLSFWNGNEPDNWEQEDPDGEDCARIGPSGSDMRCWFDKSCQFPHRFICEKEAARRVPPV